jgi:YidC/Oxa1 family membrane protein insertase
MQQQQSRSNLLVFFLLAFIIYVAWTDLRNRLWPPPKADKAGEAAAKVDKPGEAGGPATPFRLPPAPPVTPQDRLVRLGSDDRGSAFHLGVLLDPRGAGVRRIVLNKFQAADWLGRPDWIDAQQRVPRPLELVSSDANEPAPSYLLNHYDVRDPTDDKPLDTLGRAQWKGDAKVTEDALEDGRKRQRVSFTALAQGVEVTKTYTLVENDYHLGLEVRLRRKGGGPEGAFRYQLTGAHGLPVEGKWYTNVFRNAMVARVDDRGKVERDLQDLRQVSLWGGGNEVRKEPGLPLAWYGVAVQYFASVVAVDDRQDRRDFLAWARPTMEKAVAKGEVVSAAADHFVLRLADRRDETLTFWVHQADQEKFSGLKPGDRGAVIYRTGSYNEKARFHPLVAEEWRDQQEVTNALWVDDITVRATTEPVDLKPGAEVVHRYLLYNGPVKVSQLYDGMAVPPALVDRYNDRLHLNVLTDYQSPGVMGSFSHAIGFTWVVVKCTNLMHVVLGFLHWVIPSYGLCIILLTVLVRGLMFPVSRKQQLMSFRMQKLAPELKKLQEKHKDDRQALGMAQMELYRRHGVNPFGTCWFLLLQMPVFIGLYVALQESIHFRLAEFWPTWIVNLAAPDMLLYWGENIPIISRPESYGGLFYLGPFFNILPLFAIALMIWQQKVLSPPPADEQQAMQMKIMRYMMIFMGLFFYKVAAGLCIYFIASSAWSYAERKLLLPKAAPDVGPVSSEGLFQRLLARAQATQGQPATAVTPGPATAVTPERGGRRDRDRGRRRPERGRVEEPTPNGSGLLSRLRQWWQRVLEEARKK